MASQDCPLPEIGEALGPYIKSRDEVAAVRQALQSHLQSQLKSDGTPLSSVTLTRATSSQLGPPPASISGIRGTYWKALQAHNVAQAKYDALRTDLDKLKHQRPNLVIGGSQPSTTISEDYVPLLRQKEKQRKLKAIETAYSGIISAGGDPPTTALEDVVKRQIGEPPVPPSTRPSLNRSSDAESKILELKKVLISTKRRVEQRMNNVAPSEVDGVGAFSPQIEIAGLQHVLQELTVWMESQLTIIANAEATAQPPESPTRGGALNDTNMSTNDIETLYQAYLEARERLVQTVNDPPATSFDHANDLVPETSNSSDTYPQSKSSAETLLPYIPTLLAGKQDEQALLQQSAYTRRRITSAEEATDRLLRRLADESHLVQPGASSGGNWATAAREASDATRTYIKSRVEVGERSARSASQALENIKSMSGSLDRLLQST